MSQVSIGLEGKSTFDYIIIGAGIAGTVLASRLHQKNPTLSVLLIEAGHDQSQHPHVPGPLTVALLKGSKADWNYATTPQKHLNGRQCYAAAGKGLGGGSIINYGVWTRADSQDYDVWAKLVGDHRWSYEGLLPYFRKTETYHDLDAAKEQHGFHGPVTTASVTSSGRRYPLRQPLKDAWASIGVNEIKDINCGSPLGLAEIVESRTDGKRLIASSVYSLKGVHVLTDTLISRILTEDIDGQVRATGVEILDGKTFTAQREVIVSAGSLRTPQLLMLSGIGPIPELDKHKIPLVFENPGVGRNLWDHIGTKQFWKLRRPEAGASVGAAAWKDPLFSKGNPIDWFACQSISQDGLNAALLQDGVSHAEAAVLTSTPRCHTCTTVQYVATNPAEPAIPMDGSHVTSYVLSMLPTSRGSVSLASADVTDSPVIDFNYYSTEADRYRMREGLRKFATVMDESEAGRYTFEGESVPEGYKRVGKDTPDEEVDRRVRQSASSIFHPSGTASMGKVVDNELRIFGVQNLRVVDASVIPCPIASPIQACIYALAEQAADMIHP